MSRDHEIPSAYEIPESIRRQFRITKHFHPDHLTAEEKLTVIREMLFDLDWETSRDDVWFLVLEEIEHIVMTTKDEEDGEHVGWNWNRKEEK